MLANQPLRRGWRILMRRNVLVTWFILFVTSYLFGQVATSELARPPADARHFIIESPGGKHGDSWSWLTADGTRMARESMNLRGMVWEMDYSGKAGEDGMPASVAIRGVNPSGDGAETLTISNGTATWKSQIDAGSAPYAGNVYYTMQNGPMDSNAWFLERLLAMPDKKMKLLPGGEARAEKLTSLDVGAGPIRQTIDLWAITGLNTSPVLMWADSRGRFFAINN